MFCLLSQAAILHDCTKAETQISNPNTIESYFTSYISWHNSTFRVFLAFEVHYWRLRFGNVLHILDEWTISSSGVLWRLKPRPHDRAAPTGKQVLSNHSVDNTSALGSIANGQWYLPNLVATTKSDGYISQKVMPAGLALACGHSLSVIHTHL